MGSDENWRSDAKPENTEKRGFPIFYSFILKFLLVLRSVEDWFRVRMLQYSIECIDKLMCFAVRGSVLEIAENLALVWFLIVFLIVMFFYLLIEFPTVFSCK